MFEFSDCAGDGKPKVKGASALERGPWRCCLGEWFGLGARLFRPKLPRLP